MIKGCLFQGNYSQSMECILIKLGKYCNASKIVSLLWRFQFSCLSPWFVSQIEWLKGEQPEPGPLICLCICFLTCKMRGLNCEFPLGTDLPQEPLRSVHCMGRNHRMPDSPFVPLTSWYALGLKNSLGCLVIGGGFFLWRHQCGI